METKHKHTCSSCNHYESCEEDKVVGYACSIDTKKKIKTRLARIEGQVRGITNMVEKEAHCDDILIQIASVRSALGGLSKAILEGHIRHCVVDDIKNGNDSKSVDDLLITLERMLKL